MCEEKKKKSDTSYPDSVGDKISPLADPNPPTESEIAEGFAFKPDVSST